MIDRLTFYYRVASDRRNLTLVFFIFLSLGITYATINSIEFNYQLDQQARELEGEVAVLEQKNQNQALRNEFFASSYYSELSARDQLGLVAEGERVLVFSDTIINRRKTALGLDEPPVEVVQVEEPSNFEQWLSFFKGQDPS